MQETLQTLLAEKFPLLVNPKLGHQFHFVHRLDFVTSGVVCIALNKKAAKEAGDGFSKRDVSKFYLALVRGWPEGEIFSISKPIGCNEMLFCPNLTVTLSSRR